MWNTLKRKAHSLGKIVVALLPWMVSMYVFYWLDSSGTWTRETPHRGKISVMLLSAGMAMSLFIYSALDRPGSK